MNILYLHSHDTGRYIQPYGYPVNTPHLQKLAEESVFFRDAHCAAPTCSPSRAALLTGQTPHEAGMVALAHRGGRLLHPERHLANFLKSKGFRTRKSGISHVGSGDDTHGYTEVREGNNDGWEIARDAAAFLDQQDDGTPFFLDAGFIETHRLGTGFNREADQPGDGDGTPDYLMPPAVLPDRPETRRDWLDFRHSVERLDRFYGHILEALERNGLAENTLVLATTDHGIAFPGMKCSLTSHGTGVLCILRLPGGEGAGKVTDAQINHLDIFPTVCDLLGEPAPAWLEGKSLLPLIRGEVENLHEALFAEVTFHAGFEPKRSVRTDRWTYIRNADAPRNTVMANCDQGLSKDYWMNFGMADRAVPAEELYDRIFDPQECCNLADKPEHEKLLKEMRERLHQWMLETHDSLLSSDPAVMPLPQTVNPPDHLHPGKEGAEDWDPSTWAPLI